MFVPFQSLHIYFFPKPVHPCHSICWAIETLHVCITSHHATLPVSVILSPPALLIVWFQLWCNCVLQQHLTYIWRCLSKACSSIPLTFKRLEAPWKVPRNWFHSRSHQLSNDCDIIYYHPKHLLSDATSAIHCIDHAHTLFYTVLTYWGHQNYRLYVTCIIALTCGSNHQILCIKHMQDRNCPNPHLLLLSFESFE